MRVDSSRHVRRGWFGPVVATTTQGLHRHGTAETYREFPSQSRRPDRARPRHGRSVPDELLLFGGRSCRPSPTLSPSGGGGGRTEPSFDFETSRPRWRLHMTQLISAAPTCRRWPDTLARGPWASPQTTGGCTRCTWNRQQRASDRVDRSSVLSCWNVFFGNGAIGGRSSPAGAL